MPAQSKDYKFKFSFVMPIYNVEKYLAETVESILAQDMDFEENCQIIFVNDGSPDNSEEVCLRYQQQFPDNIKYIKQKNQGVSAARNNGIAVAEGKYISLIDPDDKLSQDTLTEVYGFFEKHQDEIDFVSIKLEFFGTREGEHPLNYKFDRDRVVDITKDIQDVQLSGATAFFASRVFKQSGHKFDPSVGHFGEDMKLMAEVVLDKMAYGVVAKPTYFYRKRGDESALGSATFKKFWYKKTPEVLHKQIIRYAKAKLGYIPRYTQYLVMYDLQWRFKQSRQQILTLAEENQYRERLNQLLQHIDDDVILSQRHIPIENKFYILGKKHRKSILDLATRQGLGFYLGKNKVYDLSEARPVVTIEFFEAKNDRLVVEGYFNSFLFKDCRLVFEVNGKRFNIQSVNQPKKRKLFLGEVFYDRNCFKVELPLRPNQRIRAKYLVPDSEEDLRIKTGRFSGFSWGVKRPYRVLNNLIIVKTPRSFGIKKYNFRSHLTREIQTQIDILKSGHMKVSLIRCLYYTQKLFTIRRIWLISDRIYAAGDNGEAFFRYLSNSIPNGVRPIFAISKNSVDFKRMKTYGHVVNRQSLRYKLLFLLSDKVISSHADEFVVNPFKDQLGYLNDLLNFDFIFLQHGITKDDMSGWLERYSKNIKLFVTAATYEFKSIMGSQYSYDKNVPVLTGLPRYDLLESKTQNKLIIAPTWRKYLAGNLETRSAKREYNEAFVESEYHNFYQKLISDSRIAKVLVKHKMTGEFYLHPSLSEHVNDFKAGKRFSIKSMPYDYKTAFAEGNLLVTDFSSVAFDFAYLKKPIIYSQFDFEDFYKTQWSPGYFSYPDHGFGPITYDYESTVQQIIKTIESGNKMPAKYQKRVDNFFAFTDKNNSQRVYEAIKQLDRRKHSTRNHKEQSRFSDRLLDSPVFIFSSVRSGSTLLSSILNAHSEIYSPQETHFTSWRAEIGDNTAAILGMEELGLNPKSAQYLLWDRILSSALKLSDKDVMVEKTPWSVIEWEAITECWPKSKVIFLLRHPVSIAQSWQDANPDWSKESVYNYVLRYASAIEEARRNISQATITVKYEDILKKPENTLKSICKLIGVDYEPEMLNYGSHIDIKERYKRGVGDWGEKIQSGRIQQGRKLPRKDQIPVELLEICTTWGYLK